MNILIIDGNDARRAPLLTLLLRSGHEVVAYSDARRALDHVSSRQYDLAIVNMMTPGIHGLTLIQMLKQRTPHTLILAITCAVAVEQRVSSLDAGADDVLIEPVAMLELEARIRALLRRRFADPSGVFCVGPLVIDSNKSLVTLKGTVVALRPTERGLLETLTGKKGRVVTKAEIAAHWCEQGGAPSDMAIIICVHRLRKQLTPYGLTIRTVRGRGYVLEAPLQVRPNRPV